MLQTPYLSYLLAPLFHGDSLLTIIKYVQYDCMYTALYLSPMIHSSDVNETAEFFTNLFLFKIGRQESNYVILYKDNLTIHIKRAFNDAYTAEIYLEVDEIDTVWNSIKDKVKMMEVREPFDREYGMREFHIMIPHTKTLMFVGQEIK